MVDSIGVVVLAASGGDPVADDAKATVKAGIITQKSPSERLIGQPDGPTNANPSTRSSIHRERAAMRLRGVAGALAVAVLTLTACANSGNGVTSGASTAKGPVNVCSMTVRWST
jgi:hypothetical protein